MRYDDHYKLCYVRDSWVYFTTQSLEKQWGDDWNDIPFECNAGKPYEWDAEAYVPGDAPAWDIVKVAYSGDFETPDSRCNSTNSPYSVEIINNGAVPWLSTSLYSPPPHTHIYAGVSYSEFVRLVQSAGGKVYEEIEKELVG